MVEKAKTPKGASGEKRKIEEHPAKDLKKKKEDKVENVTVESNNGHKNKSVTAKKAETKVTPKKKEDSDSDSDSSDESEEEVKKAAPVQSNKNTTPAKKAEKKVESKKPESKKAETKIAPKKVAEESDSDSDSDSESEKEVKKPEAKKVETKKVEAKVETKKAETKTKVETKVAPKKVAEESDSDSDSDSESEKEEKKPAPVQSNKNTPAKKAEKVEPKKAETKKVETKVAPKKVAEESDSDSDSDSESEEEVKKPAPVQSNKRERDESVEQPNSKKSKKGEQNQSSEHEGHKHSPNDDLYKLPKTDYQVPNDNQGQNESDPFRLFLGNLSYHASEDDIREFFTNADCNVAEVHLVRDKETGKFYGTGFVSLASQEDSQKALALSGSDCGGRAIKIEASRARAGGAKKSVVNSIPKPQSQFQGQGERRPVPESCRTIFLGRIGDGVVDDDIRELFKDFADDISDIRWVNDRETGNFKGCGFVSVNNHESVVKALEFDGASIHGRPIRVDFSETQRKPFGGDGQSFGGDKPRFGASRGGRGGGRGSFGGRGGGRGGFGGSQFSGTRKSF